MRGTAAIVLVFDLVNFDSFSKLDSYLETARNGAGNVPILLVGNKSDLETEEELGQVIHQNEIDDWMRLHQITDFMKTSAKTGENVRKMFTKVTIMSLVDIDENPRMGEVRDGGFLFKIVVIGAAGVGKTSLVHRFTENVFLQDYKLTVGVDFIVKNLEIDEDLLPTDVLQNLKTYMEEKEPKQPIKPITPPDAEKPIKPEPFAIASTQKIEKPLPKPAPKKEPTLIHPPKEVPPEKVISVIYNKQMILNSRNKFILQIQSEHFFTDPYVEITIKPEFPGCIVTPNEIILDQAKPEEQIEFNITPMSVGDLEDASMKILHDQKQRYTFHTPSKVVSQVSSWILIGICLAFLLLGPLFGETFFSGYSIGPLSITLISLILAAVLLVFGLISYFSKKQKHTDHADFTIKDGNND